MPLLEGTAHICRLWPHKGICACVWSRGSSLRWLLVSMFLPLSDKSWVCKRLPGILTRQRSIEPSRSDCSCRLPGECGIPRFDPPSLYFLNWLWSHVHHSARSWEAVKFVCNVLDSLLMVAGRKWRAVVLISLDLDFIAEHVQLFAEVFAHFICDYL